MTRLLYFIVLLALPNVSFSQETKDKITFLDSNYVKVEEGKHAYFQIVRDYYLRKEYYVIEEYYKSGHQKMGGISTHNDNYNYVGVVIRFFENDTIMSKTLYENGTPSGNFSSWYENGKKEVEGEYVANQFSKNKEQVLKILHFWDENGIQQVSDGNGVYNEKRENFQVKGEIRNGLKTGIWTGTDKKFKISFSDKYEDGKFISGVSKDDNLIEKPYTEIYERPSPKKGITDFYNFVGRKFNTGRNTNVTGKIILTFIVNKNGAIDKIEVLRGIHPKFDKEAVRVLNLYADWIPGKYRGKSVDVRYSLPISVIPN